MKIKVLLLTLVALFLGVAASAQRKEMTVKQVVYSDKGDFTYQYVKKQNGDNCYDGPFSFVSNYEYDNPTGYFWGTYFDEMKGSHIIRHSYEGSHMMGSLHGTLTASYIDNFTHVRGEKSVRKYFWKGCFDNGILNGNFTCKLANGEINVNYMNGLLVGSYYVKIPHTNHNNNALTGTRPRYGYFGEKSGKLTTEGKPTGIWKFVDDDSSYEQEFLNGILVNSSNYDSDLCAKAKLYAQGKVSESDLNKENIYIKRAELGLYRFAEYLLREQSDIIDFGKLGFAYFSMDKEVEYFRLFRCPFFTEEGFSKLKEVFKEGSFDGLSKINGDKNKDECKYNGRFICDTLSGLYYCSVYGEMCVGYPEWKNGSARVYITEEQQKELDAIIHTQKMAGAISFRELEKNLRYKITVLRPSEGKVSSTIKDVFDSIKEQLVESDYKDYFYCRFYEWDLGRYLSKKDWYKFAIWTGNEQSILNGASAEELALMNASKAEFGDSLNLLEELERKEFEDLKKVFVPALNFMMKFDSPKRIYWADYEKYCANFDILDTPKQLKPFYPMVSYEIQHIEKLKYRDEYAVTCLITTQKGKKAPVVWEIVLKFMGSKIDMSSFTVTSTSLYKERVAMMSL